MINDLTKKLLLSIAVAAGIYFIFTGLSIIFGYVDLHMHPYLRDATQWSNYFIFSKHFCAYCIMFNKKSMMFFAGLIPALIMFSAMIASAFGG